MAFCPQPVVYVDPAAVCKPKITIPLIHWRDANDS